MLARLLAMLSVAQLALAFLPPLTWRLWLVHLVALELAPLAALTGLLAAVLAQESWVRALGLAGVVGGLLPAVAIAPGYLAHGAGFSLARWLYVAEPEGRVDRDVPFGAGLVVDVYRPASSGPHPFVLVVHGGGWRSGDKGDLPHVAHALAREGFVVVDLRYRLEPFPAALVDTRRALDEVHRRASALEVDPARGALLGRSAGGQVALLAAYAPAEAFEAPWHPVRAVVAVYAPTDLAWDHAHPYVPDVVDGTSALEQYLGGPPTAVPERYRQATPMRWLDHPVPPTLLLHGTAERCVRPENATFLAEALRERGQPVETLFIPFADHGFDVRRGGLGEQLARAVLVRFLRRELQKE